MPAIRGLRFACPGLISQVPPAFEFFSVFQRAGGRPQHNLRRPLDHTRGSERSYPGMFSGAEIVGVGIAIGCGTSETPPIPTPIASVSIELLQHLRVGLLQARRLEMTPRLS